MANPFMDSFRKEAPGLFDDATDDEMAQAIHRVHFSDVDYRQYLEAIDMVPKMGERMKEVPSSFVRGVGITTQLSGAAHEMVGHQLAKMEKKRPGITEGLNQILTHEPFMQYGLPKEIPPEEQWPVGESMIRGGKMLGKAGQKVIDIAGERPAYMPSLSKENYKTLIADPAWWANSLAENASNFLLAIGGGLIGGPAGAYGTAFMLEAGAAYKEAKESGKLAVFTKEDFDATA